MSFSPDFLPVRKALKVIFFGREMGPPITPAQSSIWNISHPSFQWMHDSIAQFGGVHCCFGGFELIFKIYFKYFQISLKLETANERFRVLLDGVILCDGFSGDKTDPTNRVACHWLQWTMTCWSKVTKPPRCFFRHYYSQCFQFIYLFHHICVNF